MTRIEQVIEVCKNRTVKEDELYGAVMTAINRLLAGGNNMIKILEEKHSCSDWRNDRLSNLRDKHLIR